MKSPMYTECQNTVTVTWHVGKLFIMIRSNNIFQPLVECCEVLCHWSIFHNNEERSLFSWVTNYLELRSISDSLDAQHLSLLFVARVHQESFYQNGRYSYRQSRISSREKALLLQQLILSHYFYLTFWLTSLQETLRSRRKAVESQRRSVRGPDEGIFIEFAYLKRDR